MESPSMGFFLEPCGGSLAEALADEYGRWRSECEACGKIYEEELELAKSKMIDHLSIVHGDRGWMEGIRRYEEAIEITDAGRAYLKERGI